MILKTGRLNLWEQQPTRTAVASRGGDRARRVDGGF